MASVFITGANRGIGFELARQYASDGWRVHAASRKPETAERIAGDVVGHRLDVTDVNQVAAITTPPGFPMSRTWKVSKQARGITTCVTHCHC